jgi:hypothetical protein
LNPPPENYPQFFLSTLWSQHDISKAARELEQFLSLNDNIGAEKSGYVMAFQALNSDGALQLVDLLELQDKSIVTPERLPLAAPNTFPLLGVGKKASNGEFIRFSSYQILHPNGSVETISSGFSVLQAGDIVLIPRSEVHSQTYDYDDTDLIFDLSRILLSTQLTIGLSSQKLFIKTNLPLILGMRSVQLSGASISSLLEGSGLASVGTGDELANEIFVIQAAISILVGTLGALGAWIGILLTPSSEFDPNNINRGQIELPRNPFDLLSGFPLYPDDMFDPNIFDDIELPPPPFPRDPGGFNLGEAPTARDFIYEMRVIPRPGMRERVLTDRNGREARIYGQAERGSSTTPGHAEAMNDLAEQLAQSGDYDYITIQRSWGTATERESTSRKIPDVIGVRRDGRVDVWEVESKTDDPETLQQRLDDAMETLPEQNRGSTQVIKPKVMP